MALRKDVFEKKIPGFIKVAECLKIRYYKERTKKRFYLCN